MRTDDNIDIARLPLAEYAPVSKLRLERTRVERPRFAVIDFHTHLGRWLSPDGDWMASDLAGRRHDAWAVEVESYLELCDRHSIETSINLDGGWDAELEANLDRLDRAHPGRFVTFCQLDWTRATVGDDFGDELAESLRRSAAAGARGLKVWKTLGLGFRDAAGELLLPDDERAAPVFEAAGELGLPVLIHTADPPAFFDPVDRHNERLEELLAHPEWSFCGPEFPSHERLMESFESMVAAHPRTIFVGAHLAGNAEDLAWLGSLLDRRPNLSRRHLGAGLRPRAPAASGAAVHRPPSRPDPVRLRPAAADRRGTGADLPLPRVRATRPTSTPVTRSRPPPGAGRSPRSGSRMRACGRSMPTTPAGSWANGERSSDGEQA